MAIPQIQCHSRTQSHVQRESPRHTSQLQPWPHTKCIPEALLSSVIFYYILNRRPAPSGLR